jgi:hypothetical protein
MIKKIKWTVGQREIIPVVSVRQRKEILFDFWCKKIKLLFDETMIMSALCLH